MDMVLNILMIVVVCLGGLLSYLMYCMIKINCQQPRVFEWDKLVEEDTKQVYLQKQAFNWNIKKFSSVKPLVYSIVAVISVYAGVPDAGSLILVVLGLSGLAWRILSCAFSNKIEYIKYWPLIPSLWSLTLSIVLVKVVYDFFPFLIIQ